MNKKYDTLYARDSLNNVRVWSMEQESDKYRTISGLQDGQLVTSEWTVAIPKNEGKRNSTTGVQQAESEIKNRYKKQLKTGYFENICDIDQEAYFQVMLAKSYEDYKHKIDWKTGIGVQIKFNGGRIVARKDGLFTRKGERYQSLPHLEQGLKPFFEIYPEAVLDGEGFNYDLRERLNEIMSLLRKTVHISPDDLAKSKELIKFYVYDGALDQASLSLGYLERKQKLDQAFAKLGGISVIGKVATEVIHSEKELENLYGKFINDNHEGAIIRILNQPYQNKRSNYLLKYKPVDDSEAVIQDILEGEGNWSGTGKVIMLKWGNREFNATFKGTHEEAKQFLQDKLKWVGKEITFEYNGLTGLGIPNYARVDIQNCLKK